MSKSSTLTGLLHTLVTEISQTRGIIQSMKNMQNPNEMNFQIARRTLETVEKTNDDIQ
jgi:hypothetical protein